MDSRVLAGIVLYNPEADRLRDNIEAIRTQVDYVLLIDNGSNNKTYTEFIKGYDNLAIITNVKNQGIAYALNQICGYAHTHDFNWVLTLDQDSVATPGMVDTYKSIVDDTIGILGCWIHDRGYQIDESWGIEHGTFETDWVITSAAFTNVKAWKDCGGFDNDMFIEWVDWDICEAMRKAGYKIMKTYKTKLVHELGHNTRLVMVRHHQMQVMNHKPLRYYYSVRNRIYMSKKYIHINLLEQLKEIGFKLYTVERYEKNKFKNFIAIIKGTIAGFFMEVKYDNIKEDFFK